MPRGGSIIAPAVALLCACAAERLSPASPSAQGGPACVPIETASGDARAASERAAQCSGEHWLGRLGLPCDEALRFYSARSLETLGACTDRAFESADAGTAREQVAQRAGHDCTDALLRGAPADPCARALVAREACARARACGREERLPGCSDRGEAQLHHAVESTVGLWSQAGRELLARCVGDLACGSDAGHTTQIDCLVTATTGRNPSGE